MTVRTSGVIQPSVAYQRGDRTANKNFPRCPSCSEYIQMRSNVEYHRLAVDEISILPPNSSKFSSFAAMIKPWKIIMGISLFLVFIMFFFGGSPVDNVDKVVNDNPKLLLISFDGFRYDLLNETLVPNIYRWAQQSTWFVNGSKSQFLTMTAPNHLSIVTGLYEENHGVPGNRFHIDKERIVDYYGSPEAQKRSQKLVASSAVLQGDPIWLTNERAGNGRRSSVYFWPFCEAYFTISPHKPKSCTPWYEYGTKSKWMIEIDNIADELARPKSATNFVTWYVDQPDAILHQRGFFTGDFERVVKDLDFVWGYLIKKFKARGLLDKVNIILTADHGHTEIPSYKNVLCIRDFVKGNIRFGDLKIYPDDERHEEEIYKNLTQGIKEKGLKVKVYRSKDFPQKFHYINNPRAGGIIIEPEIDYTASFGCTTESQEKRFGTDGFSEFHSSTHGHSPENKEMRAFLVMGGPDIIKSKKIYDIPENIDLYSMMSRLLKIQPSPNNGTLKVVGEALITKGTYDNY